MLGNEGKKDQAAPVTAEAPASAKAEGRSAPSPFETVEPEVANPKVGEPILTPPPRKKRGAPASEMARPKCYAIIHDRPKVLITKGDRKGEILDLEKKPRGFFAADGLCSCQDPEIPRAVTEPERAKQIIRAARDEERCFIEEDPERARLKRRARERAREARRERE